MILEVIQGVEVLSAVAASPVLWAVEEQMLLHFGVCELLYSWCFVPGLKLIVFFLRKAPVAQEGLVLAVDIRGPGFSAFLTFATAGARMRLVQRGELLLGLGVLEPDYAELRVVQAGGTVQSRLFLVLLYIFHHRALA